MPFPLEKLKLLANECGFELAGAIPAAPLPEAEFYRQWIQQGMAAGMTYLSGHRADLRDDPRALLPSARSVISVGKLYNTPPRSGTGDVGPQVGWISRYAWSRDYHRILRHDLNLLIDKLKLALGQPFEWKICVDTAPLLERACAYRAGLGWIGKNSCLIHQGTGSWHFLGEALVSFDIEPGEPPPSRCGSCTRCIDACPTRAIVPSGRPDGPPFTVDSRRCLSYLTIELRDSVPEALRGGMGNHVFGCDICQDVCPWNRRAPVTSDPAMAPRLAPAGLSEYVTQDFHQAFQGTPVLRARYGGFLRNVAIAMGNSGFESFREPLRQLAASAIPLVAEHAAWALRKLG